MALPEQRGDRSRVCKPCAFWARRIPLIVVVGVETCRRERDWVSSIFGRLVGKSAISTAGSTAAGA